MIIAYLIQESTHRPTLRDTAVYSTRVSGKIEKMQIFHSLFFNLVGTLYQVKLKWRSAKKRKTKKQQQYLEETKTRLDNLPGFRL